MIDGPLLDIVTDRVKIGGRTSSAEDLVIASCDGPDALHAALRGTSPERPSPAPNQDTGPTELLGAYLTSLTVEGLADISSAVIVAELAPLRIDLAFPTPRRIASRFPCVRLMAQSPSAAPALDGHQEASFEAHRPAIEEPAYGPSDIVEPV